MSAQTYRVFGLAEALSPITHAQGSRGNESLVAREPVVTPRGVLYVPTLSGNAIRYRLVRAPGFRWLIEQYGLRGKLTLPQLNFLLHGGNLTEGGGRENLRRVASWQRLFPLGRLLGGCLPDQILSGALLPSSGVLVCEENRHTLASLLPDGWQLPDCPLRPAEAFVSGYQYVRQDAARTSPDLLPPRTRDTLFEEEEPLERGASRDRGNQMIFSGQAVLRGACFALTFTLQHVAPLELGALLHSLALWQAEGGTVGGMGARGHGKLRLAIHCDAEGDPVAEYVAHALAVRDEAAAWLMDVFAPRPKAKGKRARAATEEADG